MSGPPELKENTSNKQTWRWVSSHLLDQSWNSDLTERDGWGTFGTQVHWSAAGNFSRDVSRTLQGSIYWNWHESRLEAMCCEEGARWKAACCDAGETHWQAVARIMVRLAVELPRCPASPICYHCIARKVQSWQGSAPASQNKKKEK